MVKEATGRKTAKSMKENLMKAKLMDKEPCFGQTKALSSTRENGRMARGREKELLSTKMQRNYIRATSSRMSHLAKAKSTLKMVSSTAVKSRMVKQMATVFCTSLKAA